MKILKPTRSGVILEKATETDYIFGVSAIDNTIRVPDGNWTQYLPKGEKQRQGFESMCCTNFASTSAIEMLLTRIIEQKTISVGNLKWLNDNGYIDDSGHINFSDRFDALVSGTKPESGNSLKAVAQAKHEYGMIPEKMLPWTDNQNEYFNKSLITPEMYALGKEFLKRFPIHYELVYRANYAEALKVSPLAAAVYAWNGQNNGVYFKVSYPINHAITIFEPPVVWQIWDSYEPYVKQLADNYLYYDYAIRYVVSEVPDIPSAPVKKKMYRLLRDPKDTSEVYAFNEEGNVKRHIVNKQTLVEGAKAFDQYWIWDKGTTSEAIVVATQTEFDGAIEMAEINLLPKDTEVSTGKKSFWRWLFWWVKRNN